MRNDQLIRQWKILRYLMAHQNGRTVAEICKEIKARKRTAYRDLQALDRAGFKVRHWWEGRTALWSCDQEPLPKNRSFPSSDSWQTVYGGDK